MSGPSASVVAALRVFATCDIGDALVKLKLPYGGYLDGLKMYSPEREGGTAKIFGEAITVKMVSADDKSSPSLPKHFCDFNERDKIMFISQPKGMFSACWGGLMTTRARALGAPGVIVDGRFRDILEQREMKFPVFARGTSILGSNGYTRASEVNVPIEFAKDLWINPGDYLMGDADGVVVIPKDKIQQVVDLCTERKRIDDLTFDALHNGEPIGEAIKRLRKSS
ncbi:ribonuclease E inhibitor RraA/Dimethylmenaquinone methyltransferase [Lipomyces oligophaga]|uniref:ribonuclease E inhibitor RraA/Dimethylmenaquinone methyltransferase n=1 Tax=Lipomyces oligophaga TaxID=45792 RepID=UPI0034CEF4FB